MPTRRMAFVCLLLIALCNLSDASRAFSCFGPPQTSRATGSTDSAKESATSPSSEREQKHKAERDKDKFEIGLYRPGTGTVILGELTKDLDVRHLREGETVECTVIQDLLYSGKIIVPHGAKIRGHVTEARIRGKQQLESHLGMVFDVILLKDKKELPFQHPALIQAVASPISMGSVPTTRVNDMPIFMPKGSTTGGAAIDALSANASLAGANMPSTSGAISAANRGVIGLPGLTLDSATSVIRSSKGNVKLPYAAQLLLRVTDPAEVGAKH